MGKRNLEIPKTGEGCIHRGRTGLPKICTWGYECWHCAFDQWIEEIESGHFIGKTTSQEKTLPMAD